MSMNHDASDQESGAVTVPPPWSSCSEANRAEQAGDPPAFQAFAIQSGLEIWLLLSGKQSDGKQEWAGKKEIRGWVPSPFRCLMQ